MVPKDCGFSVDLAAALTSGEAETEAPRRNHIQYSQWGKARAD